MPPTIDPAALFDASPNAYVVLDAQAHIVTANRAYLALLERDLDALVGRSAWQSFPTDPETERLLVESIRRVIDTGRPDTMALLRFDIERPASDGGGLARRYWSITHSPLPDPGGAVAFVLQNPVDVTALETARDAGSADSGETARRATAFFDRAATVSQDNAALKAVSAQFSRLFEQAPSFIALLTGPEHRFELANSSYRALTGRDDLVGRTFADALGDATEQGYLDLLDRVYATGEAYATHGARYLVHADVETAAIERFVDFVCQPITGSDGDVVGVVVQGIDTTERVRGEQAARDSAERLRMVVESARDHAIFTTDPAGLITSWSAGAASIFGWSADEALGRVASMIFTPEDRASGADHHELATAAATGFANDQRWHLRKDGGRVYMNGSVHRLPDGVDGRAQGFIKIARDETDRRRADEAVRHLNETLERRVEERTAELLAAEDQLRQAQKVEALGQLTGGVAHDFNNLLTVIRGSVDLLRRPGVSDERRTRYVDAISDTTDRAAKLTSQLLAFARRQTLKPTIFDARKSVLNLLDMLRSLSGTPIAIDVRLPDGPCAVDVDPSQFDTAIVNMVANARDAMTNGGTLTIAIAVVDEMPVIRSHRAVPGDFVAVSLTDTGEGIAADRIDRIFEPFFTTKGVGQGTGLGLSQVFGFAKQSGGEVAVASDAGHGATFTLYLPRAKDALDLVEATDDGQTDHGGHGARVLVVEDNAEVGAFATEALRELGYEVALAKDASQALALLAVPGHGIDGMFSDVVMPGMSGIELGREVRRLYPQLPIVLTSGYSNVLARDGTDGFALMHKPYSIDELARALRKARFRRDA